MAHVIRIETTTDKDALDGMSHQWTWNEEDNKGQENTGSEHSIACGSGNSVDECEQDYCMRFFWQPRSSRSCDGDLITPQPNTRSTTT